MSRHSLSCYLGGGALLLTPLFAGASGIHALDAVTPFAATASAGHATDTGVTASYNNPAGLGWFQGQELYIGATVTDDSLTFYDEGSTTGPDADADERRKDSIDYSLGVSFAPTFFYASSIDDNLAYGISLAPMVGGGVDFGSNWVGSGFVNNSVVMVAGLSLALGHRINDAWSLGASLGAAYLSWELDMEPMPNATGAIELEDVQPYWQLGLMYQPTDTTRMGLRYLSEVDFEPSGDADLDLNGHKVRTDAEMAHFNLPNMVSFSINHQLTERLAVLADVKWSEWSSMEENKLTLTGGGIPDMEMLVDRNWRDTWGGAVGVIYQQSEALSLKAGVSYDGSPVAKEDHKLDPPLDRHIRYALGFTYAPIEQNWSVDLSYQYLDLGDAEVNQAIPDDSSPVYVVKGSSKSHVNIFNLALGYRF
ncbi:outer membrane protein transport protein [Photobacterium sagamiensis]|uniref:OmpP1/FadL family transporter n=1 Tax=Photobacterium sagamiensis TaxID=2910241 RepID=UPI003D12853F